jgi:hypothetical protein
MKNLEFSADHSRAIETHPTDAGYMKIEFLLASDGASVGLVSGYAASLAEAYQWLNAVNEAAQ